MNGKALWVTLEAKPGKEAKVEKFLQAGQGLVEAEPKTVSWFAIKIGPSRYGIFDTFADDSGRNAHLNGKVAQALKEKASELLGKPPLMRNRSDRVEVPRIIAERAELVPKLWR